MTTQGSTGRGKRLRRPEPDAAEAQHEPVPKRTSPATPEKKRKIRMRRPWVAISQPGLQTLSSRGAVPLHLRLWFLAAARVNEVGHAEFSPGQLCQELSTVDHSTGELRVPSASTVSHALKRAKEEGYLHRDSSARCLVVPPLVINCGTGGARCSYHRINVRGRLGVRP